MKVSLVAAKMLSIIEEEDTEDAELQGRLVGRENVQSALTLKFLLSGSLKMQSKQLAVWSKIPHKKQEN